MTGRLAGAWALFVLLGAGLLLAACGGGGSQDQLPTTGNYAPIKPAPILKNNENGIDPGVLSRNGSDVSTVIRALGPSPGAAAGTRRYQLEVTNTSSIGFITSFSWDPPPGTTVVEITASSKGTCTVSNGEIVCQASLHPPTCTCKGDGGRMTIDFTARGEASKPGHAHGGVGASLNVLTQTPVPYVIPSSVQRPSDANDLPYCKSGERSTPRKPCVAHG